MPCWTCGGGRRRTMEDFESFLSSILYLRDSCEMKVLIIHGVICIYLNCRNGDKHPLFSTLGLFMRLIIIK